MPRQRHAAFAPRVRLPNCRAPFRWAGAPSLLLFVLVACRSEEAAQPSESIGARLPPKYVLSDIPAPYACVPQVITSSTDSTETALTTFENTCGPLQSRVDLRQWGMEFSDYYGLDPIQGDLQWQLRNTVDFQNMPSPTTILYNYDQGGGFGIAEFNPPVRKVEFHYAMLKRTRAIWGGRLVEFADSFRVRALDSLGQQIVAKTLYSNATSTTPPWDVWTPVALSSPSGDNIAFLALDGAAHLDNVKITRAPLQCSSVARANVVTCQAVTGGTVERWTYEPDDTTNLPSRSADSARTWRGRLVAPGTVSVTVAAPTGTRTYRTRVQPQPRGWAFSWSSKWGVYTGYPLFNYDGEPNTLPNSSNFHGANCPLYQGVGRCDSPYWYQPYPGEFGDSVRVTAVTDSGPNAGYWYVTEVPYRMQRVGTTTKGATAASPFTHPVPNPSQACRKALGVGAKGPVFANWYQFNASCSPAPKVSMTQVTASILGHEGRGYNGGIGHQTRAEAEAGRSLNDPYATLEQYVRSDSLALITAAADAVVEMNDRVKLATKETTPSGNPNIYGNWSGNVWYWFSDSTKWILKGVSW